MYALLVDQSTWQALPYDQSDGGDGGTKACTRACTKACTKARTQLLSWSSTSIPTSTRSDSANACRISLTSACGNRSLLVLLLVRAEDLDRSPLVRGSRSPHRISRFAIAIARYSDSFAIAIAIAIADR